MAHVTDHLDINGMHLSNRLVMAPFSTYRADPDGSVSDQVVDFYQQRSADGAFGLIITAHAYVTPHAKGKPGQSSIMRDCDVQGLARIVQAVHDNGVKVAVQLNHVGSAARGTGLAPLGPSAGENPAFADGVQAGELSVQQIQEIVQAFGQGARRAREAGFDAIEVHSAHGYLLNQFLSPLTNRRTDAYTGATLQGRTLLHRQVLQAVRDQVGDGFPIIVRVGACDYMPGGTTLEEGVEVARMLQQWGADALDISGGLCRYQREGHDEEGYFGELSHAIRDAVDIPVILAGGIVTRAGVDGVLQRGDADLVAAGRAPFGNPHWARDVLAG